MNESVIYLPEVDSTNLWAKHNLDKFGPIGAVYTTHQTAGRGRLGRSWLDAPHKGLYYTAVIRTDLVQPATLPLFASLAVCDALRERYRIDCQIKWPNDLLLNGKKIVGILCEVGPDGHSIVVGIGINLAQPQEYFDAAGLPHGTSLALQGVPVDMDTDPEWLAQYMTDFGFDRALYTYEAEGFAPYRERYKALCVNLGRRVTYDGGAGTAVDVDDEGRLIVRDETGDTRVFTGEVSVKGIYGAVLSLPPRWGRACPARSFPAGIRPLCTSGPHMCGPYCSIKKQSVPPIPGRTLCFFNSSSDISVPAATRHRQRRSRGPTQK